MSLPPTVHSPTSRSFQHDPCWLTPKLHITGWSTLFITAACRLFQFAPGYSGAAPLYNRSGSNEAPKLISSMCPLRLWILLENVYPSVYSILAFACLVIHSVSLLLFDTCFCSIVIQMHDFVGICCRTRGQSHKCRKHRHISHSLS